MKKSRGLKILEEYSAKEYFFLGRGMSSEVFHDGEWVYKVFLLEEIESLKYKRFILGNLKHRMDLFNKSEFFYPIEKLIEVDSDVYILIYSYQESLPCHTFTAEEIIPFLTECWERRVVFPDIKPENFVRVNGKLKWIDYEPDKFTDNLFLNMAARAFIFSKYPDKDSSFLKKLCRSAINQFNLDELKGIQEFMNRLFVHIIYKESISAIPSSEPICDLHLESQDHLMQLLNESTDDFKVISLPFTENLNPDTLFYQLLKKNYYLARLQTHEVSIDKDNYFTPRFVYLYLNKLKKPSSKVSLIIKACLQDAQIIYEAAAQIVKQTASPSRFDERILALDIKKENFLRQYSSDESWDFFISEARRLVGDQVIDRIILPEEKDILRTNQKWFNLNTSISHSEKNIPVGSQLYAFDMAKNDFILQVDCDAMIGRSDSTHDFLAEMLKEFDQNDRVVSVGFNIYHGDKTDFIPYEGFVKGGFVPEVRFCLLNRERIQKILPLPNELTTRGIKLSWYRAMEEQQRKTDTCSIRGGNSRTFYIHPQNFKKTDKDVWFTMVDRVEKLSIPDVQVDHVDLQGSYYHWTSPKRNESLVIITCMRNIATGRFLRYWYSLINQSFTNWGLILIDDASENGIAWYLNEYIQPYTDKVTFIKNHFQVGVGQNTYKAIHYFMDNPDSIVVILDGDDALIGSNALKNVYEKYSYFNADVVIGKMFRTDKLHAHYQYTPDFISPRKHGGNVWQHLRSFKKYLFDSLDFHDLKIKPEKPTNGEIELITDDQKKKIFPEYCWDFAYMVPIVEMAENPMIINHFNLLHDRTTPSTIEIKKLKEAEVAQILNKNPKKKEDIIHGRKTFLPNLNKIEIDITYECNLACKNCNRSSPQAPTKSEISMLQIQTFVKESIELGKKWELINLLGGEPTLHHQFNEIVHEILFQYIIPYSPETILQITSNGAGTFVQEQLNHLPDYPQIKLNQNSFKEESDTSYFSPFNVAPVDTPNSSDFAFHKGCWITSYCGIGLNKNGYYPCGVAGGIDRVFKLGKGIGSLKKVNESIADLLESFCRLCGHFTDFAHNHGNFIPRNEKAAVSKAEISPTWKRQYRIYNEK